MRRHFRGIVVIY